MQQQSLRRLLCLILLLTVIPGLALASLRVTFFDERMGTSALVQADGQAMLIDAGPGVSTEKILSFLDGTGLQKIDLLAGTLLREDHIGGLGAVLNKYRVDSLWLPGTLAEDPVFQNLLATIQASDTKLTIPLPGDQYDLGTAKITVLEFPGRTDGDAYTPGLVLRIDYAAFSFVFTSGSGIVSESGPVSNGASLNVDVLAIDNYDSGSLSRLLLDTVSPSWVISGDDGEISQEETLTILKDQGIHALQPGRDRPIIFNTDGKKLQAEHASSGIIIQSSVNLREDASTGSGKVAALAKGTVVTVLGTTAGWEGLWYAIEADGKTGFVRGDLIEEISLEEAEKLLAKATPKPRSSNGYAQNDGSVVETQEDSPADCH